MTAGKARWPILIADDSQGQLDTLSMILKRKGYTVESAGDGLDAVHKASDRRIRIVLMDIRMPEMDGFTAWDKIGETNPGVKILFITAYAFEELIPFILKNRPHRLFYKPVDPFKVMEAIDAFSAKGGGGGLALLLDDDRDMCTVIHEGVKSKGLKAEFQSTCAEALSGGKLAGTDVLVIRERIELLTGLKAFMKMGKDSPGLITVMNVFHTRNTQDLVRDALSAGGCACLHKPVDIETLLEVIDGISRGLEEGPGTPS
jgi:DNA-binding NtrC family response regulator